MSRAATIRRCRRRRAFPLATHALRDSSARSPILRIRKRRAQDTRATGAVARLPTVGNFTLSHTARRLRHAAQLPCSILVSAKTGLVTSRACNGLGRRCRIGVSKFACSTRFARRLLCQLLVLARTTRTTGVLVLLHSRIHRPVA